MQRLARPERDALQKAIDAHNYRETVRLATLLLDGQPDTPEPGRLLLLVDRAWAYGALGEYKQARSDLLIVPVLGITCLPANWPPPGVNSVSLSDTAGSGKLHSRRSLRPWKSPSRLETR